MLQKYSKLLVNEKIKDSYMKLSKHMQPKQDGNQPSISVTLNFHVIKGQRRMRKFITMEAQFIKVVNGGAKSKLKRLKSLLSRKAIVMVKIFNTIFDHNIPVIMTKYKCKHTGTCNPSKKNSLLQRSRLVNYLKN